MVASCTFAARGGMCESFLEAETVGIGLPARLFRSQSPRAHEDGLITRKLSVDPPVVWFIVCPCEELPQANSVGDEIDRGPIEPGRDLVPGCASLDGSNERQECEPLFHAVAVLVNEIRAAVARDSQRCGLLHPYRRTAWIGVAQISRG